MIRCNNCDAHIDRRVAHRVNFSLQGFCPDVEYAKEHMYEQTDQRKTESGDLCEGCQNAAFRRLKELAVEFALEPRKTAGEAEP